MYNDDRCLSRDGAPNALRYIETKGYGWVCLLLNSSLFLLSLFCKGNVLFFLFVWSFGRDNILSHRSCVYIESHTICT